ncbi:MAG: hypothetical protein WDO56_01655 [Gammaproteobacteria bacterium]
MPSSQDVTVAGTSSPFVKAEYFNQMSKTITSIPSTWTATATRNEYNIDYDWGSGAPGPTGIGVDAFTVRWTGSVIPTTTEAMTFYTVTDGRRAALDQQHVGHRQVARRERH